MKINCKNGAVSVKVEMFKFLNHLNDLFEQFLFIIQFIPTHTEFTFSLLASKQRLTISSSKKALFIRFLCKC